MSRGIVVCYYTVDTPYEVEYEAFARNVASYGLEIDATAIASVGSWVGNCHQKPDIIRAALERHPDRTLMYLDVDARLSRYPDLIDTFVGDVSFHRRNGWELLSGTMLWRSNARTLALVDLWRRCRSQSPGQWDQRTLDTAIGLAETEIPDLRVVPLPPEYAKIFDIMQGVANPVVTHYQASRRLKKIINARAS